MRAWRNWGSRWVAVAGTVFVLLTLGIAAGAAYVLSQNWELPQVTPPDGTSGTSLPASESPTSAGEVARQLEVIKVCMQVIGVGVVGAVLAAAAATLESARRGREAHARDRREQFEVSSDLLSRSTSCAQSMYLRCQHFRRLQAAPAPAQKTKFWSRVTSALSNTMATTSQQPAQSAPGQAAPAQAAPAQAGPAQAGPAQPASAQPGPAITGKDRADLDLAYLEFSADSAAIEGEIKARFGPCPMMPSQKTTAQDDKSRRAQIDPGPDQSGWRWHQIRDLLTVYYFSLTGDFSGNALESNAFDYKGGFHSGLPLEGIANRTVAVTQPNHEPAPDDATKFDRVAWAVQHEFPAALGAFTEALLQDTHREADRRRRSKPHKGPREARVSREKARSKGLRLSSMFRRQPSQPGKV